MKKYIFTALLVLSMFVSAPAKAAEVTWECTNTYRDNCSLKITVTLNNEALELDSSAGKLYWCGSWNSIDSCSMSGTYTVLNGEMTVKELAEMEVSFYTKKKLLSCYQFFSPYVCSQ